MEKLISRNQYIDAVYHKDAGETHNYRKYCPICDTDTIEMDCIFETGYYQRTCYLVCKCGQHVINWD